LKRQPFPYFAKGRDHVGLVLVPTGLLFLAQLRLRVYHDKVKFNTLWPKRQRMLFPIDSSKGCEEGQIAIVTFGLLQQRMSIRIQSECDCENAKFGYAISFVDEVRQLLKEVTLPLTSREILFAP
jgi:hypothetical protein